MTRVLIVGLMAGLIASPLRADTLRDAAARAVAETAWQEAQAERREGIPKGFLWTGIGLLAAGGLYLAIDALVNGDPFKWAWRKVRRQPP